jgi:hypothetical protein
MTRLLAQLNIPGGSIPYPQGFLYTGNQGIGSIISSAIPLVIGLAGLGLLLMIISAGYTLMTSAGDAKKMEMGKQRLTYAIVGFILVFGAYWAVQIIGVMFGNSITPGF